MHLFAHVSEVKRASNGLSVAALVGLDRTDRAVRDSDRYRAAAERQKRRRAARRFNRYFDS